MDPPWVLAMNSSGSANQNFTNTGQFLELDSVIMNQSGAFSLILGAGALTDLNIGVGAYVPGEILPWKSCTCQAKSGEGASPGFVRHAIVAAMHHWE